MEKVTLETMNYMLLSNTVYGVINWAKSQVSHVIKYPSKPIFKESFNSTEAKKYALLLKDYEKSIKHYSSELKKQSVITSQINEQILLFIKEQSGLDTIPDKYIDKVYSLAWDRAHSEGYYGVYCYLLDLVAIFK